MHVNPGGIDPYPPPEKPVKLETGTPSNLCITGGPNETLEGTGDQEKKAESQEAHLARSQAGEEAAEAKGETDGHCFAGVAERRGFAGRTL